MEKAHSGSSYEVDDFLDYWAYASDSLMSDAMKNLPLRT
jgi:hypothetical protein